MKLEEDYFIFKQTIRLEILKMEDRINELKEAIEALNRIVLNIRR